MRKETITKFKDYQNALNMTYGGDVGSSFTAIDEPQSNQLEAKIKESSAFLKEISIIPVIERKGQKIFLDMPSLASRTATTSSVRRQPASVPDLDAQFYDCAQTNFDSAVGYDTLDSMATFPNFKTMMSNQKITAIAQDRIKIGFNGTNRATTTDRTANPNLEDVNIGWFKQVQTNAPDQILNDGATAGEIRIGAGGDYETIDQAVVDLHLNVIGEEHTTDSDLVVLIGRELLQKKLFEIYTKTGNPQDYLALTQIGNDLSKLNITIAGFKAYLAPSFKARGLWLTSLKNLAIYSQTTGKRRKVSDEPEYNRIADYMSSNEDYQVQLYKKFAALNDVNIKLEGEWTPVVP